MDILIIEDDALKTRLLKEFLRPVYNDACITSESSYNTGIRILLSRKFDLLFLDMSMPTFTDDFYDSEVSFEKFAGIMILRTLKRKGRLVPTILFTMFDDFGSGDYSISLQQVDESLKSEFKPFYLGYVYFESGNNSWMNKILSILNDNNFNS